MLFLQICLSNNIKNVKRHIYISFSLITYTKQIFKEAEVETELKKIF